MEIKKPKIKIILIAFSAIIIGLSFYWIGPFLMKFYTGQIASKKEDSQSQKSASIVLASKYIDLFTKFVKAGKIALYDSEKGILVAQIAQKGKPLEVSSQEMTKITRGADEFFKTEKGQQALKEAGLPTDKSAQQGKTVFGDTLPEKNPSLEVSENASAPIASKEQYQAGMAKYTPELDSAAKAQVQEGAPEFAKWIQNNYGEDSVLGGSLIPPILSKAEKIEVLDPAGNLLRTIDVPESARESFLKSIIRSPKDADIIIPLGKEGTAQAAVKEVSLTEPNSGLTDLSEKAKSLFTGQEKMDLDFIQSKVPENTWRVTTPEGTFTIPAIDEAFGSKTLSALTSDLRSAKTMKVNSDFESLWDAAKVAGVSDEELYNSAKKFLMAEENPGALAQSLDDILANRSSVSAKLKDFLGKLREDTDIFPGGTKAEAVANNGAEASALVAPLAGLEAIKNDPLTDDMDLPDTPKEQEAQAKLDASYASLDSSPYDLSPQEMDQIVAAMPSAPAESSPYLDSWNRGAEAVNNNLLEPVGVTVPLGFGVLGALGVAGATDVAMTLVSPPVAAALLATQAVFALPSVINDPSIVTKPLAEIAQGTKNFLTTPFDPNGPPLQVDDYGQPKNSIITDDPGLFVAANSVNQSTTTQSVAGDYNKALENFDQAQKSYDTAYNEFKNGNLSQADLDKAKENYKQVASDYYKESNLYDAQAKVADAYNSGSLGSGDEAVQKANDLNKALEGGSVIPGQIDSKIQEVSGGTVYTLNSDNQLVSPNGEIFSGATTALVQNDTQNITDAGQNGKITTDGGPFKEISNVSLVGDPLEDTSVIGKPKSLNQAPGYPEGWTYKGTWNPEGENEVRSPSQFVDNFGMVDTPPYRNDSYSVYNLPYSTTQNSPEIQFVPQPLLAQQETVGRSTLYPGYVPSQGFDPQTGLGEIGASGRKLPGSGSGSNNTNERRGEMITAIDPQITGDTNYQNDFAGSTTPLPPNKASDFERAQVLKILSDSGKLQTEQDQNSKGLEYLNGKTGEINQKISDNDLNKNNLLEEAKKIPEGDSALEEIKQQQVQAEETGRNLNLVKGDLEYQTEILNGRNQTIQSIEKDIKQMQLNNESGVSNKELMKGIDSTNIGQAMAESSLNSERVNKLTEEMNIVGDRKNEIAKEIDGGLVNNSSESNLGKEYDYLQSKYNILSEPLIPLLGDEITSNKNSINLNKDLSLENIKTTNDNLATKNDEIIQTLKNIKESYQNELNSSLDIDRNNFLKEKSIDINNIEKDYNSTKIDNINKQLKQGGGGPSEDLGAYNKNIEQLNQNKQELENRNNVLQNENNQYKSDITPQTIAYNQETGQFVDEKTGLPVNNIGDRFASKEANSITDAPYAATTSENTPTNEAPLSQSFEVTMPTPEQMAPISESFQSKMKAFAEAYPNASKYETFLEANRVIDEAVNKNGLDPAVAEKFKQQTTEIMAVSNTYSKDNESSGPNENQLGDNQLGPDGKPLRNRDNSDGPTVDQIPSVTPSGDPTDSPSKGTDSNVTPNVDNSVRNLLPRQGESVPDNSFKMMGVGYEVVEDPAGKTAFDNAVKEQEIAKSFSGTPSQEPETEATLASNVLPSTGGFENQQPDPVTGLKPNGKPPTSPATGQPFDGTSFNADNAAAYLENDNWTTQEKTRQGEIEANKAAIRDIEEGNGGQPNEQSEELKARNVTLQAQSDLWQEISNKDSQLETINKEINNTPDPERLAELDRQAKELENAQSDLQARYDQVENDIGSNSLENAVKSYEADNVARDEIIKNLQARIDSISQNDPNDPRIANLQKDIEENINMQSWNDERIEKISGQLIKDQYDSNEAKIATIEEDMRTLDSNDPQYAKLEKEYNGLIEENTGLEPALKLIQPPSVIDTPSGENKDYVQNQPGAPQTMTAGANPDLLEGATTNDAPPIGTAPTTPADQKSNPFATMGPSYEPQVANTGDRSESTLPSDTIANDAWINGSKADTNSELTSIAQSQNYLAELNDYEKATADSLYGNNSQLLNEAGYTVSYKTGFDVTDGRKLSSEEIAGAKGQADWIGKQNTAMQERLAEVRQEISDKKAEIDDKINAYATENNLDVKDVKGNLDDIRAEKDWLNSEENTKDWSTKFQESATEGLINTANNVAKSATDPSKIGPTIAEYFGLGTNNTAETKTAEKTDEPTVAKGPVDTTDQNGDRSASLLEVSNTPDTVNMTDTVLTPEEISSTVNSDGADRSGTVASPEPNLGGQDLVQQTGLSKGDIQSTSPASYLTEPATLSTGERFPSDGDRTEKYNPYWVDDNASSGSFNPLINSSSSEKTIAPPFSPSPSPVIPSEAPLAPSIGPPPYLSNFTDSNGKPQGDGSTLYPLIPNEETLNKMYDYDPNTNKLSLKDNWQDILGVKGTGLNIKGSSTEEIIDAKVKAGDMTEKEKEKFMEQKDNQSVEMPDGTDLRNSQTGETNTDDPDKKPDTVKKPEDELLET